MTAAKKKAVVGKVAAAKRAAPKRTRCLPPDEVTARAERVIVFIERYLRVPEGKYVGQPMKLREWQKARLRKIYGRPGVRTVIWSMAKKNGKTAIIAMIVLAHLAGPEAVRNSQIRSGAQSREQAAIVFNYAAKMVRMSPELSAMVVVRDTAKELFCHVTGVHYKALSAEASTAHGQSPVLTIHDELGQVTGPRSDLYSALETAMGAHDAPMSFVISTQAPTDADLLSTLIDSAKALGENDPTTLLFLDEVPEDADIWDEKTWYLANPALGDFLNLDELRASARKAQRLPALEASFRNLNLNQRCAAEAHFLSPAVWKLNDGASDFRVLEEGEVYVGADLSSTQDLTCLIAGAKDQGTWHMKVWFFLPEHGLKERAERDRVPYDLWVEQGLIILTPGKSIDEDRIADIVVPVLKPLNIKQIGYDRWQFESLRKAFARSPHHWEPPFLADFGQGFKSMTPALKEVERLALDGKLRHGNHPVLKMCAANARVVTDDAGNRKLTKRRSIGRIDGLVAMVTMVGSSLTNEDDEESVYERRGLLMV